MAKSKHGNNRGPLGGKKQTKYEKLGIRKTGASLKEIRRSLIQAQEFCAVGQWEKALPPLLTAWDAMPEDINILTLLCHALAVLGVRDKAILVLEQTLKIHGETPEILSVMLMLAREMGMSSVALKLAQKLVHLEPTKPEHYVNLATALGAAQQLDQAIETLQQVIPLFPDHADLWNVLATSVRSRDGAQASVVFFEEALRLSPNDFKIYSNYGQTLVMLGQHEKALEINLKSIELNPHSPEPRMGTGNLLFCQGRMEEAWEHYDFRLNTRRASNQTQIYTHKLPNWKGEDLAGKTLMVCAEQGIGDEVMWGNFLPFLYERTEKLIIGCDHRLVSLYQRRFPEADVERYYDQMQQGYRYRSLPKAEYKMEHGELSVDFAIPVASIARYEWNSVEDVKPHPDGFLRPSPELLDDFASKLNAISNKPKVALAWRSGLMTSDRTYIYSSVELLGPIMALGEHVDFVNIQYGNVEEELALAESMYGVKIHQLEGVDLRADIEANIAIMSACDMVVSSPSAPGQFALASGTPTIIMSAPEIWWGFGAGGKVLFAEDGEMIFGGETVDWNDITSRVANKVRERLSL